MSPTFITSSTFSSALKLKILDVAHTVLAGHKLDKRADGNDARDLAVIELANLGHEHDVVDNGLGCLAGFQVFACDIDAAVILDVDFAAGFRGDLLDDLAAGANNLMRILSGSIFMESILGAVAASSALGSAMQGSMISSRI